MSERCETCRYYKAESAKGGVCRLYPPVVPTSIGAVPVQATMWPKVSPDDWCGQHLASQPDTD